MDQVEPNVENISVPSANIDYIENVLEHMIKNLKIVNTKFSKNIETMNTDLEGLKEKVKSLKEEKKKE